jgi:hypothetical protein
MTNPLDSPFASASSCDVEENMLLFQITAYCDPILSLFQASKDVEESSHTDSTNQESRKRQQTKESLQAEVCAKFTALMTIFTSDVKLEEEYLKEFQVSARTC